MVKRIGDTLYFTFAETGLKIGRNYYTISEWCKYNEELEQEGKELIIPKPTEINGVLHFSEHQVEELKTFVKSKKRGDLIGISQKKTNNIGMKELQKKYDELDTEYQKMLKHLFRLEKEKEEMAKEFQRKYSELENKYKTMKEGK